MTVSLEIKIRWLLGMEAQVIRSFGCENIPWKPKIQREMSVLLLAANHIEECFYFFQKYISLITISARFYICGSIHK